MKHLSIIICILFSSSAFAEDIYKWTDATGKTHYSSKPQSKDAKIASLPQIMRGEVKVPPSQLISCKTHGGVDCQAGTDEDGSVVCGDGFKDSAQRYRFSCSAPKLEVSQITDRQQDGTYSIFVRNSRSVTAQAPSVVIRQPDGSKANLSGPKEIDAFGVAEFKYPNSTSTAPKSKAEIAMIDKPTFENIDINCRNCPG